MLLKRIVFALLVVAVMATIAPASQAACIPSKTFTSWDFTDYLYFYVYNFSGNLGASVGAFWQPFDRAASNEGTQTIDIWLRYYAATSQWYISGEWGTAGTTGCASGEMVLAMTDPKGAGADFAVGQADETPVKSAHFNFNNLNFTPIPRPQITNRSRAGDTVTLDLQFADIAGGFSTRFGHPASTYLSGINLYTFSGTADPGRDTAAWTLAQTAPYNGGITTLAGVNVDCSNHANDVFLAAGIQVTGEYDTVHLGASTIVECDPTLADPGDKFDLIREKGKGLKKGRPFRR